MSALFTSTSGQWINLGGSFTALQNVTGATLTSWMTYNGGGGTEDQSVYVSNGTSITSARANIGQRISSNVFRTSGRRLDADGVSIADSTTTLSATPRHVAGVFRYNAQQLQMFVDGVAQASVFVPGWTGSTSNTASLGASLGGRADGANTMNGRQGEVRLYSRALAAEEIASMYVSRGRDVNTFGLIHKWRMQGGFPGENLFSVLDSAIAKLNGTPTGFPFITFQEWLAAPRRRRRN